VTNKTDIYENNLVLNKILCGISISDTVVTEWEITKVEKDLAKALLKSVVAHWSILKNTSIETLQETFLKREGKLKLAKKGHYELTVKQQSIDLLLDHLPWGIGTVKTKWMDTYMTTHWI
ncbi:MAG: contractile injection system tape measure protein, partial [Saprospiraceae bacterium]|nr:contractile injection system tape measure protein [Saprospiraceae bacterium]